MNCMSRSAKTAMFLAAITVALLPFGSLQAGVTGSVSFKGKSWKVADAVAAQGAVGFELNFSPQAWDRVAWAEDGKFDSFDLSKFQGEKETNYLKIGLWSDKSYRSHELATGSFGPGVGSTESGASGLSFDAFTEEKVVGRFKFSDADYAIDVRFDLPILKRDTPLDLPGIALSADGGEPGKVLLATLSALASGDVQKMLAVSPPERRAQMAEAAKDPKFAKQLAMQKTMQPSAVQISGGKIFEDRAWVEFKGQRAGKAISGTASMQRIAGQWYMKKLSTRE